MGGVASWCRNSRIGWSKKKPLPSRNSSARPAKADSGTRITRKANRMRSDSRVTNRNPYLISVPVAATACFATAASGSFPDIGLGHVFVDDRDELRGDV